MKMPTQTQSRQWLSSTTTMFDCGCFRCGWWWAGFWLPEYCRCAVARRATLAGFVQVYPRSGAGNFPIKRGCRAILTKILFSFNKLNAVSACGKRTVMKLAWLGKTWVSGRLFNSAVILSRSCFKMAIFRLSNPCVARRICLRSNSTGSCCRVA